jgi:4-amino-4-deoxy-L-arabinose transferase-like glycosyltransferase
VSARGVAVRPVLGTAALAALLLAVYAAGHYQGVSGSDDLEYASIARNVLRGQGVTTQHLYPVDLALWGRVPHPEIAHPPGLPLLIAGSFMIFGVNDAAAVAPSAIAWIACVAMAAWLAHRLFGGVAGWVTGFLLAVNPEALGLAVSVLSELPAALLVMMSACLLLAGAGTGSALAAGMAFGVGQAFRENLLLAAPGMALLAAGGRVRRGWFAAGVAIPVAMLVARSLAITGRPWASLATLSMQGFTAVHPAQDVLRHLEATPFLEFLRAHPADFWGKWVKNAALGPVMLGRAAGVALALGLALPVFAALRVPPPVAAVRLSRSLALMLVPTILGVAAFAVFPRYFVVWVPLLAVLAGGLTARVGAGRWAKAAVAIPIVIAAAQYGWALSGHPEGNPHVKAQKFVADAVPPGQLVASDYPEIALWRADRPAAWLPVTRQEFGAMRERIPIPWVILTSQRTPEWDSSWQRVWTRRDSLPGYMEAACSLDGELEVRLFRAVR